MKTDQNTSLVSINDLWQIAIRRLARLRAKMMLGADVCRGLQELDLLLESLPLSTNEFGLARNRLKNAGRYMACAERGAAQYELKMLECNLRSWADVLTATYRPHRGVRVCQTSLHRF